MGLKSVESVVCATNYRMRLYKHPWPVSIRRCAPVCPSVCRMKFLPIRRAPDVPRTLRNIHTEGTLYYRRAAYSTDHALPTSAYRRREVNGFEAQGV